MGEREGYLARWRWVWEGRTSAPQKCSCVITMLRAQELVLNSAGEGAGIHNLERQEVTQQQKRGPGLIEFKNQGTGWQFFGIS